ncbi:hypothetical protein IHE45_12G036300 [Dioscorea alata]|uniref:Uncharacterized protein n=2 Tax=Dioscorea alata TaxID=55571 RepID=A0ACB7V178_DIOAL|nr:hypothetical protein IHE45_12G036300 [Dioscorea alata]KAH7667077.1 hypothetical protein IHE45_12G036300 [Dioscorea alata]
MVKKPSPQLFPSYLSLHLSKAASLLLATAGSHPHIFSALISAGSATAGSHPHILYGIVLPLFRPHRLMFCQILPLGTKV